MIDSPGYGDKTDIKDWRKSIIGLMKDKLVQFRSKEDEIDKRDWRPEKKRREKNKLTDERVHALLFFFDGHKPKELDM